MDLHLDVINLSPQFCNILAIDVHLYAKIGSPLPMFILYAIFLILEHGVFSLYVVNLIIQDDEFMLFVLQFVEFLLEHGDEGIALHGICLFEGSPTVHVSRYKDNSKMVIIGWLSEVEVVAGEEQGGELIAEGDDLA